VVPIAEAQAELRSAGGPLRMDVWASGHVIPRQLLAFRGPALPPTRSSVTATVGSGSFRQCRVRHRRDVTGPDAGTRGRS